MAEALSRSLCIARRFLHEDAGSTARILVTYGVSDSTTGDFIKFIDFKTILKIEIDFLKF